MLQLSAAPDAARPRRGPCLIVVPETARRVTVVAKGGDEKSSASKRCRYGEVAKKPSTSRQWYAEEDIKWLGRCDAGAILARRGQEVEQGRRWRRRSGENARFVVEVTDDVVSNGGGGRVLELRYSAANADAVRTACAGRSSSPERMSSRSGGFVLGGEDGRCAVAVRLGHAYKTRLKIFFTSAASDAKGELYPL